jgi:hypothetical protein
MAIHSESKIKGVIRHRETEEYYAGSGTWTTEAKKAMEFRSLSRVVAEAAKYHIHDCCEFVVRLLGRSDVTIALPL